jgi:uncharacterized protein (DUF1800 family)
MGGMDSMAHIAAIRFGLGPRLGDVPPADPQAWLLDQIDSAGTPPAGVTLAEAVQIRSAEAAARRATNPVGDPAETVAALRALIAAEIQTFAVQRLTSVEPFRDRLVDFWMNHFTASRRSGAVAPLLGTYEREAIRPHVTGRFADMLLAVTRHPAMLLYLDNHVSVGPTALRPAHPPRP